jgi:hypothetical protein
MSEEQLDELEDIARRSALADATHQHWFPNVYADLLCREIRRAWAENEKLPSREQFAKFLQYFDGVVLVAAVHGMAGSEPDDDLMAVREWIEARTNTDGRVKP